MFVSVEKDIAGPKKNESERTIQKVRGFEEKLKLF